MFRTFAVVLALLCIVSPPAFAQGTIRKNGGPPAPQPTDDRDQRRGARENDPVQWEVRRSMQHCLPLMISNLRREGLSRPSMLSPSIPQIKWSDDGGDWHVVYDRFYPFQPCRMGSSRYKFDEPTALFNSRNKRYLNTRLTWDILPQFVWNVRQRKGRERNGVKYERFALLSIVDRRYLMLCHDDVDARKNNETLCYYNTDQERPE